MNRTLLAPAAVTVSTIAIAITGCGSNPSPPQGGVRDAPPSTVTLSRAARVDGVPLRLDVALLRRVGRVVTLDLRLRSMAAKGGADFRLNTSLSSEWNRHDISGVYLMDPATGRALHTRVDGEACLCTGDGYNVVIAPGGTAMLTASFPAPSPKVATADVVVPHFGAFRDVPLRAD